SPPDSSTTARSAATRLAPQEFVQLQLEAHHKAILEYPLGQLARLDLTIARGEQHTAALSKRQFAQLGAAPLIVRARGDDKLDLVGIAKLLKLGVEVARFFPRPRSLHVHHPAHTRVDRRHIERPAGLERYAK